MRYYFMMKFDNFFRCDVTCYTFTNGGPVHVSLPESPGNKMNIFLTGMERSGRLVAWEYHARKSGTFWADIWRPTGNDEYKFIHKTKIDVTTTGYNVGIKMHVVL